MIVYWVIPLPDFMYIHHIFVWFWPTLLLIPSCRLARIQQSACSINNNTWASTH